MADDGRIQDDEPECSRSGQVTSRRDLLKGTAALCVTATGLPALLRAGSLSLEPRRPSRSRGGPALWNGQQVTEPIGLSYEGTPRRGGELTWAWIYEPVDQLDPQLPTTGDPGDLQALLSIYDQLTNIKPGALTNEPGLAESWAIANGGLEYTFELRDAEFSNGDKVTANDVKFSLERFANPKINGQYAFLNAIDTVEALNSRTVRVTLQYVQAMFLQVLGHATTSIVPQRIVEKLGTDFGKNPVGSGAFIFESKTPGQSITFRRNPNYWKSPKPYIDSVTFNYVPDDDARMLQVTRGLADVGYSVPYALLDQFKDVKGTRLQLEPYTNFICAIPNMRQRPFDERAVRLALNYATPRGAINKIVFKNAPRIANSVIGELQYWDPSIPAIPYDIAKAKSYLAQSSVPHGFTTTLLILGTDTDSVSVASILQSAWSEIGINLKIEDVDLNTMLTRVYSTTNPDYDIVFFYPDYASSDVGDSDELALFNYEPLSVGFGGLFYSDPHATALVNQATHTLNQTVRKRDFVALQQYCLTVNPPEIPIAFGPARTLVNSKVQGLRTLLNASWRLEDIWFNP
ncbi:MAG: ABC transporter substrate-binding protein [Acidimicrobiales bacterium]